MKNRLGVFGGTFDPPHKGHINAALAALSACDLDKVLFVVANDPWQKSGDFVAVNREDGQQSEKLGQGGNNPDGGDNSGFAGQGHKITPAALRLEMTEAAVSGHEELEASDIEIKRGGESYTADTLRELSGEDVSLFLILGADAAAGLDTWKQTEVVKSLAEIIVVPRPGFAEGKLPVGFSATWLETELVDLSGTELREKISGGLLEKSLMLSGVLEVIEKNNLYKSEKRD